MNPFFQTNIPTTKEMWKNEPNKFRQWIILLGASLLIFATLLVISIILVSTNISSIRSDLLDIMQKNISVNDWDQNSAESGVNHFIYFRLIGASVFMAILIIVGLVLYGITVYKAYKNKTFSKISGFTIYFSEFVGFLAMILMVYQFSTMVSFTQIMKENSGIIVWVSAQVFSITLFVFAWQVSRIRKQFAYAEKIEEMKKNPQFQEMQAQMQNLFAQAQQNSGNYGPTAGKTTQNDNSNSSPINAEASEIKESPEVTELKKLKIEELRNIAFQLSISGYDKMSKDELIEIIIRVTNGE
ncbi:Rho termination factor N-terminal domain-containing protein [Mycoplasma marinum]|uniref:Rho termination factor-like N-terminal domain-containing protein n=1 Tax=Mycoplasma marinum TaxID=1937190 RepID=A0A4V2NI72_9MOLU|nr:Rho termination factor N-terminal domain-containing protein [Mycoplasma marinum]TCG11751.1 hypothetical protein C4B24_01200 [Mycoplasma marinum]